MSLKEARRVIPRSASPGGRTCIGSVIVRAPLHSSLSLPSLPPPLLQPPNHKPKEFSNTKPPPPPTACGSSLYTNLDLMPDATCIKSGSIDDKAIREGKIGVEFYTKDRVAYCQGVEGADQKEVFLGS